MTSTVGLLLACDLPKDIKIDSLSRLSRLRPSWKLPVCGFSHARPIGLRYLADKWLPADLFFGPVLWFSFRCSNRSMVK